MLSQYWMSFKDEVDRLLDSARSRMSIEIDDGQALVEYTLVLALVSIIAVGALAALGDNVTGALEGVAGAVSSL
jgi:Flp pilus assembly pilin Flp